MNGISPTSPKRKLFIFKPQSNRLFFLLPISRQDNIFDNFQFWWKKYAFQEVVRNSIIFTFSNIKFEIPSKNKHSILTMIQLKISLKTPPVSSESYNLHQSAPYLLPAVSIRVNPHLFSSCFSMYNDSCCIIIINVI